MTEESDGVQANYTVNQEEQLKTETTKNKQTDSNADWVSYHIFLFPFKWELLNSSEKGDYFSVKTNVAQFDALIQNHWERKPYEKFAEIEDFNEFHYFYPFVQDVLYDYEGNENVIRHFQFKNLDSQKDTFNITVQLDWKANNQTESKPKTYMLHIKELLLNVYTTGIGILSFHLVNTDIHSTKEDILCINQFGRRLYPPFLDAKEGLIGVQKKELAKAIKVKIGGETYTDKFLEHYKDLNTINGGERKPEKSILLPEYVSDLLALDSNKVDYKPVLDDRMFVVGWYGNNELAKGIEQFSQDLEKEEKKTKKPKKGKKNKKKGVSQLPTGTYGYLHNSDASSFWYKYIFVDGRDKGLSNGLMEKELIVNHTYDRWVENYTIYGFSRYSLLGLTSPMKELKEFNADFVVTHLHTLYYKMAELCLVQRVSILNFSDEVAHISTLPLEDKRINAKIQDLYRSYLQFTNKIYFREITAQEQGIDLYDRLQRVMKLKTEVKDLGRELEELNNYAILVENEKRLLQEQEQIRIEKERALAEKRREQEQAQIEKEKEDQYKKRQKAREFQESQKTDAINRLSFIGALFLIPTFISGYYGMNIFNDTLTPYHFVSIAIIFISFLAIAYFTYKTFNIQLFEKVENRNQPDSQNDSKTTISKGWFTALIITIALLMLLPLANLCWQPREDNPSKQDQQNLIESIDAVKKQMEENNRTIKGIHELMTPKTDSTQNKK